MAPSLLACCLCWACPAWWLCSQAIALSRSRVGSKARPSLAEMWVVCDRAGAAAAAVWPAARRGGGAQGAGPWCGRATAGHYHSCGAPQDVLTLSLILSLVWRAAGGAEGAGEVHAAGRARAVRRAARGAARHGCGAALVASLKARERAVTVCFSQVEGGAGEGGGCRLHRRAVIMLGAIVIALAS